MKQLFNKYGFSEFLKEELFYNAELSVADLHFLPKFDASSVSLCFWYYHSSRILEMQNKPN